MSILLKVWHSSIGLIQNTNWVGCGEGRWYAPCEIMYEFISNAIFTRSIPLGIDVIASQRAKFAVFILFAKQLSKTNKDFVLLQIKYQILIVEHLFVRSPNSSNPNRSNESKQYIDFLSNTHKRIYQHTDWCAA